MVNFIYIFTLIDWEIQELYRKCKNKSKQVNMEDKEKEAIEKVKQKLDEFLSEKDLYFIVGNLKNHKNSFMIIGLFYPPLSPYTQLSLF